MYLPTQCYFDKIIWCLPYLPLKNSLDATYPRGNKMEITSNKAKRVKISFCLFSYSRTVSGFIMNMVICNKIVAQFITLQFFLSLYTKIIVKFCHPSQFFINSFQSSPDVEWYAWSRQMQDFAYRLHCTRHCHSPVMTPRNIPACLTYNF